MKAPNCSASQVDASKNINPVAQFVANYVTDGKWSQNGHQSENDIQPKKNAVDLINPEKVIDRILFAIF